MKSGKLSDSDPVNDEESRLSILKGTKLMLKPDADVADLFLSFNKRFFWDKLKYVEVRWSPRMTLCAGLCVYNRRPGYCSIRLSKPLLSLCGKVDLVETLLHEMIHAYLFVTENKRDRDGHGPEFLKHMDRINNEVGLNISVYHTFNKEVRHYQQHEWLCNGPCQLRPPYFGKVHRSMNREPGPTDYWFADHSRDCGGLFLKIAEPEGYKSQKKKPASKKKDPTANKNKDIRSFFKPVKDQNKNVQSCFNPHYDSSCVQRSGETSKSMDINKGRGSEETGRVVDSVEDISNRGDRNDTTIIISSEESASDNEDDASTSSDSSFNIFFGSIFNTPYGFFKRRIEDPDPKTVKIRKPDLSVMSRSKRGVLKNLIKVPDQPTLDTFYKKKISFAKKSALHASKNLGQSSQRDILKQPTVQSFLTKSIKE